MNLMSIKKYIKENCIAIIGSIMLFAIVTYIIGIYCNVARYSVNTLDDFIHYDTFQSLYTDRNFDLFDFATKYAMWDCVCLGGRYFTMFIQILLGPNPQVDIVSKNEIVMAFNALLYFVSLYVFILTVVSKIIIKNSNFIKKVFSSLFIFLAMLILHNTYQFYTEIFTWFSGATSYSFPLSILLLSISLFIIYIESNKKIKVILVPFIMVTSIAALGGSVSVLCMAFIFMLSLLIYVIVNNKFSIITFGLFIHYFCFALINVTAPGNFIRLGKNLEKDFASTKEVFDIERLTLILNYANKINVKRYIYLFSKIGFVFLLLILSCVIAFLFVKMAKDINYNKVLSVVLPFLFLPYLVSFSFAFGYQDKLQLFDRCFFIIDFCIILNALIFFSLAFSLIYSLPHIDIGSLLFKLTVVIIIVSNILIIGNTKSEEIEKYDISCIDLVTVFVDNSLNKYKDYHNKYAKIINILRENSGKETAEFKFLSYDEAPKLMMNFHDGQHMPFIDQNDKYLPLFYDIKNIIVLEE